MLLMELQMVSSPLAITQRIKKAENKESIMCLKNH